MTKKAYTINNDEMTIKADWTKLSTADKKEVKEFIELGYKFQNKNSRDGSKRKATYYENNLIEMDKAIFETLRSEKNADGKTKKGAYSKASSFASTIIKLGKYVDKHPEKEEILDQYRELVLDDVVRARIFAKGILEAA